LSITVVLTEISGANDSAGITAGDILLAAPTRAPSVRAMCVNTAIVRGIIQMAAILDWIMISMAVIGSLMTVVLFVAAVYSLVKILIKIRREKDGDDDQ